MNAFPKKLALKAVMLIVCLGLFGCDEPAPDQALDQTTEAGTAPMVAAPTTNQMRLWTNNCALCHVNGEGGAPRVAVLDDWEERNEQGRQVLLQHTIEGFNNMPPLGYCMACEEDDLVALIGFMAGGSP
jgi:cytochrome c5